MYIYQYSRPALTVDCAVFCEFRANDPFKNIWAFSGGFVDMNKDIELVVYRELKEATGFVGLGLNKFKTYGAVNRDP